MSTTQRATTWLSTKRKHQIGTSALVFLMSGKCEKFEFGFVKLCIQRLDVSGFSF
jgi:hypothetical protein